MPQLKKIEAFGPQHSNRFEWPTFSQLNALDLSEPMKLSAIEIGASTNLYGLRLHFSNNVSSPYVVASEQKEQNYQKFKIGQSSRVSDVYISQDPKTGNIQGFRMADDQGNFLVDQLWNKFNNYDMQQ